MANFGDPDREPVQHDHEGRARACRLKRERLRAVVSKSATTVVWHPERTSGSSLWHSVARTHAAKARIFDCHYESLEGWGDTQSTLKAYRRAFGNDTAGPARTILHQHARFPIFNHLDDCVAFMTIREPISWAISFVAHRRRAAKAGFHLYYGDVRDIGVLEFFDKFPAFGVNLCNWIAAASDYRCDETLLSPPTTYATADRIDPMLPVLFESAEQLLDAGRLVPLLCCARFSESLAIFNELHGHDGQSLAVDVNRNDDLDLGAHDLLQLDKIRHELSQRLQSDIAMFEFLKVKSGFLYPDADADAGAGAQECLS